MNIDHCTLFIVLRSLYNLGMRTPYGQECPYYYADYHRGRNEELMPPGRSQHGQRAVDSGCLQRLPGARDRSRQCL